MHEKEPHGLFEIQTRMQMLTLLALTGLQPTSLLFTKQLNSNTHIAGTNDKQYE
jgi:hypothetical protein